MSTYREAIDWIAKNAAEMEGTLPLDHALAVERLKTASTVALVASVWSLDEAVVAEAVLKARDHCQRTFERPLAVLAIRA